MKKLVVIGLLAISMIFTINASAQTVPTATIKVGPSVKSCPNFYTINLRFNQMMKKMKTDLLAGTITQAQATAIHNQIKAARLQEINYFKQNGNSDLTSDQTSQVTQLMNAVNP